MTKKKKWINALIFIGGLIVFLFYYFEDNGDMEAKEKNQIESSEKSSDSIFEVFEKEEFKNMENEQDSAIMEEDSIAVDSLEQVFKI